MSEMEWVMESGSSYLPLNPSSNFREAGALPLPSYVPWTLSTEEAGGKRKSNRGGMVVPFCPLVNESTDPLMVHRDREAGYTPPRRQCCPLMS